MNARQECGTSSARAAQPDLSISIGALRMRNPVMVASGCFGFGTEYAPIVDIARLGAIVVKGTTLEPWRGNPPPRIVETPAGMLNAIGLQNDGVQSLLDEKLPRLREHGVPVIVNVCGETLAEYVKLCEILDAADDVAALELNASCPNIEHGGMTFGTSCPALGELVAACRKATGKPLIVKLSPNVTDVAALARAARDAGADALSLINTLLGMAIDVDTWRPKLANVTGGLSGPAIRPVAVRMVYQVAQAVPVPTIGMGGIMTAEDAIEFLLAGATAVAVGTASFVNPQASIEIIEGIAAYLQNRQLSSVRDIIGKLQV
jgi:dihydroorotate dehydrogenase (NAD+) catalytic subunit